MAEQYWGLLEARLWCGSRAGILVGFCCFRLSCWLSFWSVFLLSVVLVCFSIVFLYVQMCSVVGRNHSGKRAEARTATRIPLMKEGIWAGIPIGYHVATHENELYVNVTGVITGIALFWMNRAAIIGKKTIVLKHSLVAEAVDVRCVGAGKGAWCGTVYHCGGRCHVCEFWNRSLS